MKRQKKNNHKQAYPFQFANKQTHFHTHTFLQTLTRILIPMVVSIVMKMTSCLAGLLFFFFNSIAMGFSVFFCSWVVVLFFCFPFFHLPCQRNQWKCTFTFTKQNKNNNNKLTNEQTNERTNKNKTSVRSTRFFLWHYFNECIKLL